MSWKKVLKRSRFCVFAISNQFFEESELIEYVLYAKSLRKPIILMIERSTIESIRDVFKDANLIGKIEFESGKDNKDKIEREIMEIVRKLEENVIKK